ncbi:P-loop containing nucleoside triphosphate hydrolase protein [Lactarius sanguifluus]|nr:P-loop containing nucleoside triphosphate hydrolase protein [Lactarius sanguifluus]
MTIDIEPSRSHKKADKKRKDRTSEATGDTEDAADEREERRKRRKKEKKREKEGAIDDANIDEVVHVKKRKHKKSATIVPEDASEQPVVDEIGTYHASPPIELGLRPQAVSRKNKKKDKSRKATVDSDVEQSRKGKKEKRRPDRIDAVPPSTSAPCTTISPSEAQAYLTKHGVSVHPPPDAPSLYPITSFDALPIPDLLRGAFSTFNEPTPVQACAWPPALAGKDVVGIAETGSGKTYAFGIPALARLLSSGSPGKGPRALVLAPTRELALQTHDALSGLKAVQCAVAFGGVDKSQQARNIQGAQVVVGTPGRILDLIGDGGLVLGAVEYLVLDEADRMLDKGFENDIRAIIGHTKQGAARQTLMFSATWPEAVRRLASSFLRDPVRVTVGSEDLSANSRVAQEIEVFDDEREKDQRLLAHLRKLAPRKKGGDLPDRILVFVLYKKEASRVENTLRRAGYAVGALHGDMTQPARLAALQQFRDGATRLLVATDVAARGLDIPDVACVLNYSFPLTVEDYIHRIGRTGRGGKDGRSITFFTGSNHERGLAGELARVLREGGVDVAPLSDKFPMAIKKKTHGVYGAFFREDVDMSAVPKKIVFED